MYENDIITNTAHTADSPLSLSYGRPDVTFAVDWALKNNYLSILSRGCHGKNGHAKKME